MPERAPREILGMHVHPTSYEMATSLIAAWSAQPEGRYVCAANVHMVMTSHDDPSFRHVVNEADLVTPDGMPLVWALRRMGVPAQARVYGPTLMQHVCRMAARERIPVALYGGAPEVLDRLVRRLRASFPELEIAFAFSPPFRPLTNGETRETLDEIRSSGARILFVGLGCPKQERWMAAHRDDLPLVQIGVGAAFDFFAGTVRQAPSWMQERGLEWAFRLAMEPRRLWKRYLRTNPRFMWLLGRQFLAGRRT